MQVGLDLVLVHCPGQGDVVLEVPGPPGSAPETTPPLPFLDVAGDHQLVIAQLDVDVVAIDTRHLGLDDPGVVGLLDVGKRGPRAAVAVGRGPDGLHQASHLLLKLLELPERIPSLHRPGRGFGASCGQGHQPLLLMVGLQFPRPLGRCGGLTSLGRELRRQALKLATAALGHLLKQRWRKPRGAGGHGKGGWHRSGNHQLGGRRNDGGRPG